MKTQGKLRARLPPLRNTNSPDEMQEGRDTVRPSQAHPQARPIAAARLDRSARRVLAGSNRSELAKNGQAVVRRAAKRSCDAGLKELRALATPPADKRGHVIAPP